MPPGARTDPQRAHFAAVKAAQTSARRALGRDAIPCLRAWCQHSTMCPSASSSPGTMPARKSWVIEVSEVTPQTTITQLFLAVMVPWLLLALALMVLCWHHACKHGSALRPRASRAEV